MLGHCFVVRCLVSFLGLKSSWRVKKELVALTWLSFWCLLAVGVLCLFLTVPSFSLQCEFVVFPDHTLKHLRIDLQTYGVSGMAWNATATPQHQELTHLLRCTIANFKLVAYWNRLERYRIESLRSC